MTQPSESRALPSEEEMDRIFAEQHERAVLELAIERRDQEAREKREAEAAAKVHRRTTQYTAPAELEYGHCKVCRSNHYRGDDKQCGINVERLKSDRRGMVPYRYFDAEASDPKVLAWLKGIVEHASVDGRGKESLLLTGPTGTGKTYQMFGLFNALVESQYKATFAVANVPALLSSLRPGGTEGDLSRFKEADWLFLDDLIGNKTSEWAEERLYELINHRYEECKTTVFTTNAAAKELGERLGERIASRLAEMCEVVAITGKDRRRVR